MPTLQRSPPHTSSQVVHVDLLAALVISVFVKLEPDALVAFVAICVRLVDLCIAGQFTVGLERARLVGAVLENDITLVVLIIT